MDFSSGLKRIMKSRGMTAQVIADRLGVTRGTVTHWSNGVRPPTSKQIENLASILQCSVAELFGEDTKIYSIQLIGLASCGIPVDYDLNGYERVPVSADIYREGMYAVRAEGDSMSPKINNNNIVYCQHNTQIDNGSIVHYSIDGESGIKKYKINDAGTIITLLPINTNYDPIVIPIEEADTLRMSRVVGAVDMDF